MKHLQVKIWWMAIQRELIFNSGIGSRDTTSMSSILESLVGWEGSKLEIKPIHMGALLNSLHFKCVCVCLVAQSVQLCDPKGCSPPGSSVHGDSPGKNPGVGCHGLLQGIFLTQGSNPGLTHCRQILYHMSSEKLEPGKLWKTEP